jgi:hypothetical protein
MSVLQDTGLDRNTIDKYYTNSNTVIKCLSIFKEEIKINDNDIIIEPSAGNGSFINDINKLNGLHKFYDIEPENELITKQDFLKLDIDKSKTYHIIGNPPFGRQSSMAIKFIKKASTFAKSISFILPKSFKKDSMKNKIPDNYHLIREIDLDNDSFVLNDKPYNVPCIFQIWLKQDIKREKIAVYEPYKYKFVKKNESPTISFRRVGVNAGKIDILIEDKNEQSHYFIQFNDDVSINIVIDELKKIKFPDNNTVGPRSISKQELIIRFNQIIQNIC